MWMEKKTKQKQEYFFAVYEVPHQKIYIIIASFSVYFVI